MYLADLAPFGYQYEDKETVAVGWLEEGYPFPVGQVPDEFIKLLKYYAQEREHGSYGYYGCNFCRSHIDSGEIHLEGENRIYIAPRMIVHYITEHNYRPPSEYIDAVLATPVVNGQPMLKIRHVPKHPWYDLTARQVVLGYKTKDILEDPRWRDEFADVLFPVIEDSGNFGVKGAIEMVNLLRDPKYKKEAS